MQVLLDPQWTVGEPDRRLFGSFVEQMGRCVYGGIFEPGHPDADAGGLRTDVLALVRELGVSTVRYPGGNFVSGYRWEDGVGPPERRPRRLDLAWHSLETNAFGVNEFMTWAGAAGVEPMLTVNLGTRGVQAACDLLEYCNHPGGTALSDLRNEHGFPQPHGVRVWCLGNELDGPWQLGHTTAAGYGRLAGQTAQAMKLIDPGIELVACGSSSHHMPTFGAWEATVLEHTYEYVDFISLHDYYDPDRTDRAGYLASALDLDSFIEEVARIADGVGAKLGSKRKVRLSVDEWGVWHRSRRGDELPREWVEAPVLSEDTFTALDAVVVGDLLITLLRHADRVGIACQAQLVNVLSPIRTERGGPAWRQSIFHPFALTARHATGTVLRTEPPGEALGFTALYDEPAGTVAIFAVNRTSEDLELAVDLRAMPALAPIEHLRIAAEAGEQRVAPQPLPCPTTDRGILTALLPATSWNLIRLE